MSKHSTDKHSGEAPSLRGQSFSESVTHRFKAMCFPQGHREACSDPRDIEAALMQIQNMGWMPPAIMETLIEILTIDPERYVSPDLSNLCDENQRQAYALLCQYPASKVIDTMARKLAWKSPEEACDLLEWMDTIIQNTTGKIEFSSLIFVTNTVYDHKRMSTQEYALEDALAIFDGIRGYLLEHPERINCSPLSSSDALLVRTTMEMHLKLWEITRASPLKN